MDRGGGLRMWSIDLLKGELCTGAGVADVVYKMEVRNRSKQTWTNLNGEDVILGFLSGGLSTVIELTQPPVDSEIRRPSLRLK